MRHAARFTVIALLTPASLAAQTAPLWRYTATTPITFFRVTPLGSVVVGTADGLAGLDPDTGSVTWKRDDLKNLKSPRYGAIEQTPFAVVRIGRGIELIDLITGATKWRMPPALADVKGYLPLSERGLILLYGTNDSLQSVLVAVELETGAVRWQRLNPFRKAPELFGLDAPAGRAGRFGSEGGSPLVTGYLGHQPALWVSDSLFILYISEDGPALVHAGTGEWLWRAEGLRGNEPPALMRGYPPLLLADSIVYVPFEKRLQAIRLRDGAWLWTKEPKFPTRIGQLELTPRGLVVRGQLGKKGGFLVGGDGPHGGKSWLDLIDPVTGGSRWSNRWEYLPNVTPFVVDQDRVYIAVQEVLVTGRLEDGAAAPVVGFEFKGGEQPYLLERRADGLLLLGNQNLLLADSTGRHHYHAYHPAPGKTSLGKVALGVLSVAGNLLLGLATMYDPSVNPDSRFIPFPSLRVRYAASEQARNYAYMLAHEADSTAQKRPVFLRLHKDDGRVVGRVWLEEKQPDYQLDRISGMLFVKKGEREILAFKM